jgi:uncharacterized membrane protein
MHTVRSSLDLAATMALAVLGLFVALIPADVWLRVVVVAPMVLVLPGYAITAIFFFPQTLPTSERLVYTIALSLAITAAAGPTEALPETGSAYRDSARYRDLGDRDSEPRRP